MKEPKQLQKALGMIGMNVTEQQAKLVIEFMEILERKGQNVTLGDVELINQRVRGEYESKAKIIS